MYIIVDQSRKPGSPPIVSCAVSILFAGLGLIRKSPSSSLVSLSSGSKAVKKGLSVSCNLHHNQSPRP